MGGVGAVEVRLCGEMLGDLGGLAFAYRLAVAAARGDQHQRQPRPRNPSARTMR